jgi:prolyl 4-hydroxylase
VVVIFYKSCSLALECYDLGRVAYTNGDFYHTLMWMQEALDHLDKETNNSSVKKLDILDHLAYATSQVDILSEDVYR